MKPNQYLPDMETAVFMSAGLLGFCVLALVFWPVITEMFTAHTVAFVLGLFAGSVAGIVALCLVTKPCESKP